MAYHVSAVLAWKFPVMNGIIFEGDQLVKWAVPDHPAIPTNEEIATWTTEFAAAQALIEPTLP